MVFAYMAFRQVMKTTGLVGSFMERGDRFLAKFQAAAKGVFSPAFVGDTISHMLTKDLQNQDGSPVNMHQYCQHTMNGYIATYGPALKAEFKAELPAIARAVLNPQSPPQGPQTAGQQLANQRWHGTGGLQAAQNFGKAAKKVPGIGPKIQEFVDGATAVAQLVPALKEIKTELFPGKGGNGDPNPQNGGGGGASPSTTTDWGPPF